MEAKSKTKRNCDQIVTIAGIIPYTYVYFHIPTDNLQFAGKTDYNFVFRRLREAVSLDLESVALSTELQARRENNIT
jgi:hypothetical protein